MSNGISAAGFFLTNTTLFANDQNIMEQLTEQLSTNTQSTSLSGYGAEAPKILSLNSLISTSQTFIDNSAYVSTYLSAYDTSLGQLSADGNQLLQSIQGFSPTDKATSDTLSSTAKALAVDIGSVLNSTVGSRYLFSGTRYSTAPVTDLTTVVPAVPAGGAAPAGPTIVSPNTTGSPPYNSPLPNYDTQGQGSPPGTDPYNQAYATQTVNLSSTEQLTYGVTSNDPSVQLLVYALGQVQAAAGMTQAQLATATGQQQQKEFLANASAALEGKSGVNNGVGALDGLKALQQQNAQNEATVSSVESQQKQSVNDLTNQLDNMTQINSALVATELTNVQNQLEASYKATASILNLSIVNSIQ
jgi:flagellar hook-associated protein 3 FlgL